MKHLSFVITLLLRLIFRVKQSAGVSTLYYQSWLTFLNSSTQRFKKLNSFKSIFIAKSLIIFFLFEQDLRRSPPIQITVQTLTAADAAGEAAVEADLAEEEVEEAIELDRIDSTMIG